MTRRGAGSIVFNRPDPMLYHSMNSLSLTPSDSSAGDSSSSDNNNNSSSSTNPNDSTNNGTDPNGIDLSFDPRLYKVRLSRATGIEYVLL